MVVHPFQMRKFLTRLAYLGTHGRLRLKISKADESGNVPETTRTVATCDMSRKEMQAYEYMCYKAAAMEWMELMIGESIEVEDINELDEACQRGVILAKLAKSFCPQVVNKIFTVRFFACGLGRGQFDALVHISGGQAVLPPLRQHLLPFQSNAGSRSTRSELVICAQCSDAAA